MGKYYFITYITKRLGKQPFDSTVADEHPFEWLKRAKSESGSKMVLISWKEISEEEFLAYKNVENNDERNEIPENRTNPLDLIHRDQSEGLRG